MYFKLKFDDLVEVFTDKLEAKIPSTCTGTVKDVLFKVDDICLVGHSLLSIEFENEETLRAHFLSKNMSCNFIKNSVKKGEEHKFNLRPIKFNH